MIDNTVLWPTHRAKDRRRKSLDLHARRTRRRLRRLTKNKPTPTPGGPHA